MRFPVWLTLVAAAVTLAAVLIIGLMVIQPDRPLIASAKFSLQSISPNADGVDDITVFEYEITRNAHVSLIFEDAEGQQYVFRDEERRVAQDYRVEFSGVVDGYQLSGEAVAGEVIRRLIPDGEYTWRLTAVAQDNGEVDEASGTLVVEEADNPLPELVEFSVFPDVFTPNQDGVRDRTVINIYVTKEAELDVYLEDEGGQRLPIARREEGRDVGEAGRFVYDYEGGVDIGADPPPDGTYTVVARAQDAEGQVTQRTSTLTIVNGGKPRAEIMAQPDGVTVVFDVQPYDDRFFSSDEALGDFVEPPDDPDVYNQLPITMLVGDMLLFKLTVLNYGEAPIRTSGPPPGTVYQQPQRAASLGEYEQSGVWRVGLECETSEVSYPWRWAIGTEDNLYTELDPATGNIYYYLPPGERSVVWGAVRMTDLVETQNPQVCYAALIHEDVEITLQNMNVGPREIELAETSSPVDN